MFEGIRAYRDQAGRRLLVFRLADHLERFWRNGRILCMEPPVSRETVAEAVVELLRRESFRTDAYIRPPLYKSACEIGPRVHDNPCDASLFATCPRWLSLWAIHIGPWCASRRPVDTW